MLFNDLLNNCNGPTTCYVPGFATTKIENVLWFNTFAKFKIGLNFYHLATIYCAVMFFNLLYIDWL